MRPLRLLLSLASSLIAITVLLYLAFGTQRQGEPRAPPAPAKKGKLKALFSFTSPASLFPPSAIISLTDDNSTFFLARPAAFGPLLPTKGLSGPLWIGTGFGDDTMGRGELGCSDVPGWSDGGDASTAGAKAALDPKRKSLSASRGDVDSPKSVLSKRTQTEDATESTANADKQDGTDDHLHHPLPASEMPKPHGKTSEHADIQSLQEGAEIAGKVVLLKRGGCGFLEKVKWAQRRGGVALIVGDDVRGGALIRMYAHGDTSNISIPALFTSHTTAHLLSSLLPFGGMIQDLSPEDAAKLELLKGGKNSKGKGKSGKKHYGGNRPTLTQSSPTQAFKKTKGAAPKSVPGKQSENSDDNGWLRSFLYVLGFGNPGRTTSKGDSRRPPSSGNIDWVLVEDWDDDHSEQKPMKTKTASKSNALKPTSTRAPGDFVIGEQDWRDPDLLPQPTSTKSRPKESATPELEAESGMKGGSVMPSSGEYSKDSSHSPNAKQNDDMADEEHKGWFSSLLGDEEDEALKAGSKRGDGSSAPSKQKSPPDPLSKEAEDSPDDPEHHEGLWVTLTPTSMSSSPFFDTLLVLVISPLVTLTVVYALLLLRSRIRRRRWRAPKSVVERLPVRTYHTISDSSSSPSPTPVSSSPTTPLLQHSHSRPTSSLSRPRSRTTSEVPATSSSFQGGRTPEEEKREAGLAEWRRRYGGRQRECVVCLEEYVDGISRVMSLPCGHEFHADCITPWLVTRRRTCPICKGDVVRSLSQSYRARGTQSPSPPRSPRRFREDSEYLQVQAAETRNDSPSASRPVPISSAAAAQEDDLYADVEANWADDQSEDGEEDGTDTSRDRGIDLGSSMRELSTTVSTTIWRGFDAIRGVAGLQRRASREEVDRDR
ncbi:uncharacterized protein BDR25DRAFT_64667 [Lindgomyces ingoldianus]|uniref:Uncharacterized protein n=1 Tax=Lindgomyces ingoldianus TaxID=673940 RepID=A0ACB6RB26_9PLEO|nr:uncharacterized protein BDR25DRAFT_64667 [Lindgomyces ingoldianus]KAF2476250.1 hypothetical protein BDR25DRAFT_64667 [Lindgomyces ingoldianus]